MAIKLLVLGSTGMLGNAVNTYFQGRPGYEVTATYRAASLAAPGRAVRFDALTDSLESLPGGFDYVINCIGVIKPFMATNPAEAIRINSLFPWELARWCGGHGSRLIHITTDCVYSGRTGKYVERDPHDALDSYGKSKSLGECTAEAMVLRTSIIGEEIHKNASLVAWAKSQRGRTVNGFSTHLWNGVTTKEYAKICDKIMSRDWYETGLFHVFAADDATKLQMLELLNERFQLELRVEEKTPEPVDRTMRTEKALCGELEIPTVRQMIEEM